MVKLVYFVILVVLAGGSMGQFPGMDMMHQVMNNVQRMGAQVQYMHTQGMRRAQSGRRFGPGTTRFRTADGGTGFAYNSPDGSSSSYSFSSGGPSHGFAYSFGPEGTFRRQW